MMILVIILALLAALIIYIISIFNNLISLKNNYSKNWANIDVLLKQRNSELPKLIETCKEYMGFEQETLMKIVKAREVAMTATVQQDLTTLGAAETELHKNLVKLFALAESYPDLKTNKSFLQLQSRISDLENSIADRRELYNDSVNVYNIRIQQFPEILVAKLFGFQLAQLLKFSPEETEDVSIQGLFKK